MSNHLQCQSSKCLLVQSFHPTVADDTVHGRSGLSFYVQFARAFSCSDLYKSLSLSFQLIDYCEHCAGTPMTKSVQRQRLPLNTEKRKIPHMAMGTNF